MKKGNQETGFDFDLWCKIAQENPEQFEMMRQQAINDLIEQSPEHLRPRMIGLQWQVDQIRKQANNPLDACLQISTKMWEHVVGENGLLNVLQEPQNLQTPTTQESQGKIYSLDQYRSGK